jgi:hypothetical protein
VKSHRYYLCKKIIKEYFERGRRKTDENHNLAKSLLTQVFRYTDALLAVRISAI